MSGTTLKRARDEGDSRDKGDANNPEGNQMQSKRANTRRYANTRDYLANNPRANNAKVEAYIPDGASAELVANILASKIVFLRARHATGAGAMPVAMNIDPVAKFALGS
jgi:hypothetical protein